MLRYFADMSDNPFLATGLCAALLASIACGVIGPYVITRRIVFLSGAIAHIALGGIGAAIFLKAHYPDYFAWFEPLYGAIVAAVAAAVLIGVVHDRVTERLDTLIGALWAMGMAAGILLIKFTPGYHTELMSYLFGNIVFVDWSQVRLMIGLDVIIVLTVLVFYKRLLAICYDPEHTRLQGVSTVVTDCLLLSLVALAVVCLIQLVGLILVIALLTLPAATASHHVSRMAPMVWVSILLCALVTTLPRMAVYGTAVSAESAIILAAGCLYLVSMVVRRVWGAVGMRSSMSEMR